MTLHPMMPIWLAAILCVGITAYLVYINFFNKKAKKPIEKIKIVNFIINVLIIINLFVINLRPMTVSENATAFVSNLDVLFVVDNTFSMYAEDYNGKNTRMHGVTKDIKYIIEKLPGASFSLITFDLNSSVKSPFTTDINYIEFILDSLDEIRDEADYRTQQGSSLNTPIDNLKPILEYSSKKEKRETVLFFMSDGENTSEEPLESYEELKQYVDMGAVLGYGTEQGGNMKYKTGSLSTEYITTGAGYQKEKAVSKIDENNLKQIASDLGINYINMNSQGNIDGKLSEIVLKAATVEGNTNLDAFDDTYYYYSISLIALIIGKLVLLKIRFGDLPSTPK